MTPTLLLSTELALPLALYTAELVVLLQKKELIFLGETYDCRFVASSMPLDVPIQSNHLTLSGNWDDSGFCTSGQNLFSVPLQYFYNGIRDNNNSNNNYNNKINWCVEIEGT